MLQRQTVPVPVHFKVAESSPADKCGCDTVIPKRLRQRGPHNISLICSNRSEVHDNLPAETAHAKLCRQGPNRRKV